MSEKVKVGDRIVIVEIEDGLSRLRKGSKGIVTNIDNDQELIWVDWDNGERLALPMAIDKYKIIKSK